MKLTNEQKKCLEPLMKEESTALVGYQLAVKHYKKAQQNINAEIKRLFPDAKIATLEHPKDGDWEVILCDQKLKEEGE